MSQTKFKIPSIYNPATQTAEEIISNFVVRLKEFDELFETIKTDQMINPPQHYIIQGQRGYGKTTLLLRINIEIKNDRALNSWLIPVMFDEEQYSVHTLAKLWEEVIEILEDQDESFSGLSDKIDPLYATNSPEEGIFSLLINALKERNKKIVLLLDNFGEMIEKFSKKENQRLREVLITCNYIRLIGSSSTMLEFYYNYKEPLFDFFKLITLDELDREETISLLNKLGDTYKVDEISKIIKEQPERIDALRRLTGGVPRTIVILFCIFVDDIDGNSFRDLEAVLDSVTPLYKDRLDNLSTQQQLIIDAIAQNWDAISTKEISKKVRMSSKAVSSQLNQLEKNQLIKKIPTSTKNFLYQINERFFNIYYLMRLGKRKNRNKVLWLVKFFEICCGEKELVEKAQNYIKALRENRLYERHAFYVSQALAKTPIPIDIQDTLLKETRKYLSSSKSEYIKELDKSHLEVFQEAIEDIKSSQYDIASKKLLSDGIPQQMIGLIIGDVLRLMSDFEKAEKFYLEAVNIGDTDAMNNLAVLYETEFKDFKKAEQYYLMAVEKGEANAMNNLALLYKTEFKDFKKAEQYYLMAVEKGEAGAMNNLAWLYYEQKKNKKEALILQREAIAKIKDDYSAHTYVMILLWNDEIEEAIEVYKNNFDNEKMQKDVNELISSILLMFIAKKQHHFVYNFFSENKFDVRDKYKPIYYALLFLMGEEYSDEYKKMGGELRETVEEIIKKIEKLSIDYA
ncbi:MAG: tetratricopeptide repeat protein [Bacteroidota bacterium]|nr:tetratricopeptide repeat protein [Bacteroidota bacterium]